MSVTYIEELIETVSYAEEEGSEWWEILDSIEDAKDLIHYASKEEPDEYQIAHLLSLVEDEDFFTEAPEISFRKCLRTLKRRLNKIK